MFIKLTRSSAFKKGCHIEPVIIPPGKIKCAVCRNWVTPIEAKLCLIDYECSACGYMKLSQATLRAAKKVSEAWIASSKKRKSIPLDEARDLAVKGFYDPDTGENTRKGEPRMIRAKSVSPATQ